MTTKNWKKGNTYIDLQDGMSHLVTCNGGLFIVANDKLGLAKSYTWYEQNGYAMTQMAGPLGKRVKLRLHQLMAGFDCSAKLNGDEIHHINRNSRDNRPENLKVLTPKEHREAHRGEKRPKKRGGSPTSSYAGVYFRKGKNVFVPRIKVSGRSLWLGSFKTELEASEAYQYALEALKALTQWIQSCK